MNSEISNGGRRPRKSMTRFIIAGIMTLYCIAIWLVLDFAYSSLITGHPRLLRVADPIFDHALSANFDDFDVYREHRHRLYTNNLGFKDTAVREVSLISSKRRIVLIGDSFTEAVGLPFEDSFAGMLYAAGQTRTPKIEILNAALVPIRPSSTTRRSSTSSILACSSMSSWSCPTCRTYWTRQSDISA
jgi:hypothetical protein